MLFILVSFMKWNYYSIWIVLFFNFPPFSGFFGIEDVYSSSSADWDLKLQQTMVEMFPLRSADAAYMKISGMLSTLGDPFTRIISPKVLQLIWFSMLFHCHADLRCQFQYSFIHRFCYVVICPRMDTIIMFSRFSSVSLQF